MIFTGFTVKETCKTRKNNDNNSSKRRFWIRKQRVVLPDWGFENKSEWVQNVILWNPQIQRTSWGFNEEGNSKEE